MSTPQLFDPLQAPFIAGRDRPQTNLPLDRFLPPYFPGRALNWVSSHAEPASWILDPFGNDPFSALELARSGYRVLVASNNPVAAFILEVMASAPTVQEVGDAVLALADLRMSEGTRLEDYLNSFYQLPCPECGRQAEISAFIWSEERTEPISMQWACPHCRGAGELPGSPEYYQRLKALPSYTLHRARALELAASLDDPLRPVMEEVVRFYSPRALILLQILLNKINHPDFTERQKKLLKALFLTTADQMNQLWTYPLGRNRPRQLIRPPTWQESNLWHAFLRSRSYWQTNLPPVTLREWPELPPQKGGISLFRGRLRELTPQPDPRLMTLVYATLPRRNQAFWNLSGLWSGWLWGKEGVTPLRHSLLRQRYDWTWHSQALVKVLSQLPGLVQKHIPILIQIGELDALFLIAGILAGQESGLRLLTCASDGGQDTLQCVWGIGRLQPTASGKNLRQAAKEAARAHLAERGEPANYLTLLTQIVVSAHQQDLLDPQPGKTLNERQEELEACLADADTFARFNPGLSPDTGQYWLRQPPIDYIPLAERLETALLELLRVNPAPSVEAVQHASNHSCPGLLTPETELVDAVMAAYADQVPGNPPIWQLRQREELEVREQDLAEIFDILRQLAGRLGYEHQSSKNVVHWITRSGSVACSFFPVLTACVTPLLHLFSRTPGQKYIIIPASRSNLVSYRLKRDPNLQQLCGETWHFVKFRQIRNLKADALVTRETFAQRVLEDPPEFQRAQLSLF
ncbi:MAG: hypothetical protein GX415_01275 [Chloroflexi bacterium]|jgi:hypothetical protein|nr:hypothetical protein [Anaerolineaceae bacterium]NLI44041.1 hypothetical protein [Chloroflexota bacterium]HOE34237.1 hypothetical protein [Anaerolineaceae bacterium]HOT25818.1 hypothetical protein [Anaerolineaceae bacterium]HQH58229.1 hypothetical protein [Anaerolineaceae bacterium]